MGKLDRISHSGNIRRNNGRSCRTVNSTLYGYGTKIMFCEPLCYFEKNSIKRSMTLQLAEPATVRVLSENAS